MLPRSREDESPTWITTCDPSALTETSAPPSGVGFSSPGMVSSALPLHPAAIALRTMEMIVKRRVAPLARLGIRLLLRRTAIPLEGQPPTGRGSWGGCHQMGSTNAADHHPVRSARKSDLFLADPRSARRSF